MTTSTLYWRWSISMALSRLTVSAVEAMLSDLLQIIEVTGTLNTEKETLIQLRTRLIEMNQVGRESLSRCADLLMPLRDELRRNTLLSRNASFLFGQMRKKGIDLTLRTFSTSHQL